MHAAVFHGKEDLRIEELPEPEVGPGAVKVRNAYAGICGTDLHIYFSPEHTGIDFTIPNPTTRATLPQILGHEVSGTVVEVGDGVHDAATYRPASATSPRARGVDVAFDAAGVSAAIDSAISGLVPGGRLVVVAMHEHPAAFNPIQLVLRETEVVGSCVYPHQEFEAVIAALSQGTFPTAGLGGRHRSRRCGVNHDKPARGPRHDGAGRSGRP